MFADDLPIHRRPGYNEKNFAGHNALSAAQSADQWAASGPGHQQKYEGIDHGRNSIVAQTIFHDEEHNERSLGTLSPHQVMSGSGFDIDPRTVTKVDPAAMPNAPFSRGVHPNVDPDNPGPQEPSPSLWHEGSYDTGMVARNRGSEDPTYGSTPYSNYLGGGNEPDATGGPVEGWNRPPLSPGQFRG